MKKLIYLAFVSILMISSCKKDEDEKPTPVAGFNYSGAGVAAPAAVTFTNTSTNASSYSWDFGDNATSTDINPTHTYTAGGVYTVRLTANGEGGSNSITKTINILTVNGPTADFSINGGGCQAPCSVSFTDLSTGATSYSWDFGDGQTSTAMNPSHTYNSGGSFAVVLTVNGPTGTGTKTRTVSIQNAPTVCKISQMSIITCPLTSSGIGWDSFSAPDFYMNIETTSGIILSNGSSSYYSDNATFPQAWSFNPTYNINNTDWSSTFRFHIWEHDSPDADDDVSYCNFTPQLYTTVGNHYPSQITLTNGSTQIQLTVQWQ